MNSMNTPNASFRGISVNQANTSASLKKLGSAQKINSAADDAAGLAISEKMRGQISGISQASQNAQNGVSIVQTADGGLSGSADILTRMRELAVQASNGTLSDGDRALLNKEFGELKEGLNQIASSTSYNGTKLLDGSLSGENAMTIQVGANGTQDSSIKFGVNDMSAAGLGLDEMDIASADGASKALEAIDSAASSVSDTRGDLGAVQNRLESEITNLAVAENNITASESRIRDLDMAKEVLKLTQKNIQDQAATAAKAHGMDLMRKNAAALLR